MLTQTGFLIEVVEADALTFDAEMLIIKYSPRSGGLDALVRSVLKKAGDSTLDDDLPQVGEYRLIQAPKGFRVEWLLVVGAPDVRRLNYEEIRTLGFNMLSSLKSAGTPVKHVVTTAQGVNITRGLDEVEAFRSLLLGFADAVEADLAPAGLEKITIVEMMPYRSTLFRTALNTFLPRDSAQESGSVTNAMHEAADEIATMLSGVESFEEDYQKPVADQTTPHVFVAMPFSDEFDDHYYLAIQPAITENKVLCVRLDQDESVFTGDIMEHVKERIRTAKLVIALLDTRNPNVYLEVGYAWGVGTPTILVLHEEEKPPFDVQGSRLLTYKRMHRLKEQLKEELRRLVK